MHRVAYVMIAGLAVGIFSTMSPNAVAGDKHYFAVLEPQTAIPTKVDTVYRTIETTTSYPVVIEGATTQTILNRRSLMPEMLERTTVAKPHHLPFSFGVWP